MCCLVLPAPFNTSRSECVGATHRWLRSSAAASVAMASAACCSHGLPAMQRGCTHVLIES